MIAGTLIVSNKNIHSQVLEQDSLALVAFYNSTGGQNWNNNSGWLTGPVNSWYGITVQANRVKKIILNSNNLNGTLPPELGQLDVLVTFAVSNTADLIGEIPDELFQIDSLNELCIGNCSITGPILNSIGNCLYLTELTLCQNNLTGTIPPEIGNLTNLKFLLLFDNNLTGPIPPELGNCTNLIELHLHNNNLEGELPAELANLSVLNSLYVSNNNLSGPIPDALSLVGCYYFLDFSNNKFDYLPPFNNWYLVSGLNVAFNKLTFDDLESHAQVGYMWFDYFPQGKMEMTIDTMLILGSDYYIYSGTGGFYTEYRWYRNGELILQSMDADTLFLDNISYSDTGIYKCWAMNSLLPDLTLERQPVHISIDTSTNIFNNYLFPRNIFFFPNPANDEITLVLPDISEYIIVKIFTLSGTYLFQDNFRNTSKPRIKIQGIKAGIYLLQIQFDNHTYSTKIIKNSRSADW